MDKRFSDKVYCDHCKTKTNHGIVAQYETKSETIDENDLQWFAKYYILQCLGCDSVAFLKEYGDETMYDDEIGHFWRVTVYPPEPEGRNPFEITPKEYKKVPKFMSYLYTQVILAYNAKSLLIATIGLRTLVEAICIDRAVAGGTVQYEGGHEKYQENLQGKINGLFEQGFIVRKQADVLHQIRALGNFAAHELKVPSLETMSSGIEVIEHILHSIYEFDGYRLVPGDKA